MTRAESPTRVLAMAPTAEAVEAMAPLVAAYQQRGMAAACVRSDLAPEAIAEAASDVDALLVIGPSRRAPRTMIPGPVLRTSDGRTVPVGWIPDTGAGVGTFAVRAAAVHDRAPKERTFAVLGQRAPRYRNLSGRIERALTPAVHGMRWTADEFGPGELSEGLGVGLAGAIYVGHGRPSGWVGYRGFRAFHLPSAPETIGAVLSLTCNTASRRRIGVSFAESLVVTGVASSVLAATTPTNHLGNARWALRIAAALGSGFETLGNVVSDVTVDDRHAVAYRLIGDPLAPMRDAPGAREAAEALNSRAALVPDGDDTRSTT